MIEGSIPAGLRDELQAIYGELAAEISATGVVCEVSGRCCNFEKIDHVLFATIMEMAVLLERKPIGTWPTSPVLCPYWVGGKCEAREDRPLGCRVYFCDPTYEAQHASRLYETYHKRLEDLARRYHFGGEYLPMVRALQRFRREGRFYDPDNPHADLRGI